MQDSKSLRSAMPKLVSSLFDDYATAFPALTRDFSLDLKKFTKRLENEGIPFVTMLLPKLSKSLLQGLEIGRYVLPDGFRRAKHSKLPAFLGGLFKMVFDADGTL